MVDDNETLQSRLLIVTAGGGEYETRLCFNWAPAHDAFNNHSKQLEITVTVLVLRTGPEVEASLAGQQRQEISHRNSLAPRQYVERAVIAQATGVLEQLANSNGGSVFGEFRHVPARVVVQGYATLRSSAVCGGNCDTPSATQTNRRDHDNPCDHASSFVHESAARTNSLLPHTTNPPSSQPVPDGRQTRQLAHQTTRSERRQPYTGWRHTPGCFQN